MQCCVHIGICCVFLFMTMTTLTSLVVEVAKCTSYMIYYVKGRLTACLLILQATKTGGWERGFTVCPSLSEWCTERLKRADVNI